MAKPKKKPGRRLPTGPPPEPVVKVELPVPVAKSLYAQLKDWLKGTEAP